jgi:hypothetical protein
MTTPTAAAGPARKQKTTAGISSLLLRRPGHDVDATASQVQKAMLQLAEGGDHWRRVEAAAAAELAPSRQ